MAHTPETIEVLKEITDNQYRLFVQTLDVLLSKASTKFIDEIGTILVTKEQKEFYDNICTVIDVLYPNEKGLLSIYIVGSGFVKLKIKE